MNASEFRTSFLKLDEPATVSDGKTGRVIGKWYPGGHECPVGTPDDAEAVRRLERALLEQRQSADEEIARLKRELAKVHAAEPLPPTTGGYSRAGDLAVRGILGKLSTGRKGRGE